MTRALVASDPMDVDAVNSLSSGKGKGSSSPRDGCFKCGGAHFQRDCNARKNTSKQSSGKQSKSWSKSEPSHTQARVKSKGKSKGTRSANQCAKGLHKGQTSKAGLSGLEHSKSEASLDIQESAQTCTTDISWNDGWNGDEWNEGVLRNGMMTGVPLDGTKVGNKRMTLPQAHFRLEVWMLVPPVV